MSAQNLAAPSDAQRGSTSSTSTSLVHKPQPSPHRSSSSASGYRSALEASGVLRAHRKLPSPVRYHESHPTVIGSSLGCPGPGAYTIKDGFDTEWLSGSIRSRLSGTSNSNAGALAGTGMKRGFTMGGRHKLAPVGGDSPGPKYDHAAKDKPLVKGGTIGKASRFGVLDRFPPGGATRSLDEGTHRPAKDGHHQQDAPQGSSRGSSKEPAERHSNRPQSRLSSADWVDNRSYTPNLTVSSTITRAPTVAFRAPTSKRLVPKLDTPSAAQRKPRGYEWHQLLQQEEMQLREAGLVNDTIQIPTKEGQKRRGKHGSGSPGATSPADAGGPRKHHRLPGVGGDGGSIGGGSSSQPIFQGLCTFGHRPQSVVSATPGPGEYDSRLYRPTSRSYQYMSGVGHGDLFKANGGPDSPLQPNPDSVRPASPTALLYLSG